MPKRLTPPPEAFYEVGVRCIQIGGSRRHGVIVGGLWSGFVTVRWDSGRLEETHIRDIRQEESR
jgi:hypothetical protein